MVRELAEHVTGRCVHDGRQGVCGNGIAGVQELEMFSRVIFEKALEEPNFSDIYAHVCRAISPLCPRFDDATVTAPLPFIIIITIGCYHLTHTHTHTRTHTHTHTHHRTRTTAHAPRTRHNSLSSL
jgi:hypothetical protein